MNYTFHPHAERELKEIESYYDSILHELGDGFRENVRLTVTRILKFPEGWQPLSGTLRRCKLSDFPLRNYLPPEAGPHSYFGGAAPSS